MVTLGCLLWVFCQVFTQGDLLVQSGRMGCGKVHEVEGAQLYGQGTAEREMARRGMGGVVCWGGVWRAWDCGGYGERGMAGKKCKT